MACLTSDQIQQIFSAFNLSEESDRERFRELEKMGHQADERANFILLDNESNPKMHEASDAKLA